MLSSLTSTAKERSEIFILNIREINKCPPNRSFSSLKTSRPRRFVSDCGGINGTFGRYQGQFDTKLCFQEFIFKFLKFVLYWIHFYFNQSINLFQFASFHTVLYIHYHILNTIRHKLGLYQSIWSIKDMKFVFFYINLKDELLRQLKAVVFQPTTIIGHLIFVKYLAKLRPIS